MAVWGLHCCNPYAILVYMKTKNYPKVRLEYLRKQLRAENISYGELAELQSLAEHIEPTDVELLEPAGVPEHK